VLHVDLEQGDRLTRRRYQKLARAMGIDLASLGDELAVAAMPQLALSMSDEATWRGLMTGRDLVIIDSLRAATPGADENASDIRAALDRLGTLSDVTGCRPLVIHHARKPSDEAGGRYAIRGSSAIYDACDSVYLFSAAKGEPVLVEHAKARSHGELVENFAFSIEDVAEGDDSRAGLRVSVHGAELVMDRRAEVAAAASAVRTRQDAEKMRKLIAATPGIGVCELRRQSRMSGDRCAAAIASLGNAVEVREERSPGRRSKSCHYLRGGA
jgi:hypothetical protein